MPEKYTREELESEWKYRFDERVGILADGRTATEREVQWAKIEVDLTAQELKKLAGS